MACVNEPLISAYLDGALGPGELDVIVGHLETCPACLEMFHAIKAVRAAVRTLPGLDPPDELVDLVGVGAWAAAPVRRVAAHPGAELSAYLDGELSTPEAATVTAHLATCSACRSELQELDAARTAIRALPRLEAPDVAFPVRVASADGASVRRRLRLRYLASAAAVAAALLALGVLGGGDQPSTVDIDRLVDHHKARQSVEAGFGVIPALLPEVNP